MKVRYLRLASDDIDQILSVIAVDRPMAAVEIAQRIRAFIDLLRDFDAGRLVGRGVKAVSVPQLP